MDLPKKTLWQDRRSSSWSFFCPSCRAARRIPYHPTPQMRHFFQVAVGAAFFSLITWPLFHWKGLVSFVPFWLIFEAIYRGRVRAALGCPHCGFDPYLYLTDVQRARREIEQHWRKKFAEKGVPFPEKDEKPQSPEAGGPGIS